LASLEPTTDTVEVECMVANSPSDGALLAGGARLVRLTLDTEVHDVVAADGAVVHHDVPGPEGDGVPLLDVEALGLLPRGGGGARRGRGHRDAALVPRESGETRGTNPS